MGHHKALWEAGSPAAADQTPEALSMRDWAQPQGQVGPLATHSPLTRTVPCQWESHRIRHLPLASWLGCRE